MKEIRLKSMEINNFKKIKSSGVLDFEKGQIEIRGKNESGKSTIADAFFWCLFGKNSNDAKVFSIKPLDVEGNEAHFITTDVTVTLSIDGVEKKFKRTYYEKYASKRGSTEKYFDGNTSDFFVNDVPIAKANDYQKEVNEVIDEELFKLLTSTTYFNSLHWTKQREIIFKLVQGITDVDIANMFEDLKELAKELENKKVEDLKAQHQLIMKECDKKIKGLPGEIKTLMEIEYDLPEGFKPEKNQVLLDLKSKKRDELLMRSSSQTKNLKAEEIEQTIYSIKSANRKLVTEKEVLLDDAERSQNIVLGEIKTKIDASKKALNAKDEDIKALSERVIKGQKILDEAFAKREGLIAEYKEIKARVFTSESDTCPTCGSRWPLEKVEEFEKHFNADKAMALEKNKENGVALKSEIEKYQKAIEELNNKIKYLELEKEEITATLGALEKEAKEIESEELVVDTSKIDAQLDINDARLKLLEAELENIEKPSEDDSTNQNQSELDTLQEEIELLAKYKVNYFNDRARRESIVLKEQEKEKAKHEYEKANKVITLIGKFIEFKGQFLADIINNPFKIVKFKLSKTNELAGTIEDACIATVDGVPFPDVNTGAKIQAGLDIIGGLQEIYQVKMPIFIDNAEAVTHWMIDLNCQQIKLYADKKYKTLTFFANGEKQEG